MLKRSFDLIVSLALLVMLLPLLSTVAILVRVKLGSPVLFTQLRSGLRSKSFYIYKFRTMTDEVDESGNLLPDRIRLTGFGHFLRRYSLDELPQLINVLKGDLSLVGPRPLLTAYDGLYTAEQARRCEVKPGITGWTQVNARNSNSWEEKFKLDTWYVENRSFWLDMKILFLTVGVLRSSGITLSESDSTAFTGSKTTESSVVREQ